MYINQTRGCFTTSSRLDNKPIIITFLAMEKVIFAMYYLNIPPPEKV